MSTPKRNFAENQFYHIYNRGNHKDAIFHDPRDYDKFLWTLSDAAAEHGVTVAAYCLMPNHYHLLVRQNEGGAIGKCLTSLGVGYVKYYNKHYATVGRLFQDRYRHRWVRDEVDLLSLSRYIHRNPVGMSNIAEYEWSSYRAYLGERNLFCDPQSVMTATGFSARSYTIFCAAASIPEVEGATELRSSRS